MAAITFDTVRIRAESALAAIRPHVRETPLEPARVLSELVGAEVYVKLENLQFTGAFKPRGAFSKLLSLPKATAAAGVVAASTGNHGAAVAYAGAELGIPATIFVPEGAAKVKIANIRRLGGEVLFYGQESGLTERHARAYADERGLPYVSPYNDDDVVAGQATIGVEISHQLPGVEALVAPVGGGGLMGGAGGYLKARDASLSVIGVSPRNSRTMIDSIRAGAIVETGHSPTISDATAGGVEPGAITFDLCRRVVDHWIAVGEDEIRAAMRVFIESEHLLIEGAAGAAIAGAIAARDRIAGKRVVVILSGANIDADRLKAAL